MDNRRNWNDYVNKIYIPVYTKHLGKSNRLKLFLRNNSYCLRALLWMTAIALLVCDLTFYLGGK